MNILDTLRRRWHSASAGRAIRRHGFQVIYVGDYHHEQTWAYSVGFQETLGAPELVVFDLPQQVAGQIFWTIYEELKSGWRFEEGAQPAAAQNRCVFRKVHPDRVAEWLAVA